MLFTSHKYSADPKTDPHTFGLFHKEKDIATDRLKYQDPVKKWQKNHKRFRSGENILTNTNYTIF